MDLIFAIQANDREFFVSRMDAVVPKGRMDAVVPKGVLTMLGKTMIVLAKAAALTSGLTVEAFAHGGGRGHAWSALRMVAR
jgi:hypothetical protein